MVDLVDVDRLGHPAFKQFCAQLLKGGVGVKDMLSQAYEDIGSRIRKDTHWNDKLELLGNSGL